LKSCQLWLGGIQAHWKWQNSTEHRWLPIHLPY